MDKSLVVAQRLEAQACDEAIAVYERWKVEHPERARAYDEAIAEIRQKRTMRKALALDPPPTDYQLPASRDVEPYFWQSAPPTEPGGPPMDAPDPDHLWYRWAMRRLGTLPAKWYDAWERGAAKAKAAGWPPHVADCWAFRVLWAKWLTHQRGNTP